jgi:hypothetical protein
MVIGCVCLHLLAFRFDFDLVTKVCFEASTAAVHIYTKWGLSAPLPDTRTGSLLWPFAGHAERHVMIPS